jgi:carbon-monoxide dehydrogenase large subunit
MAGSATAMACDEAVRRGTLIASHRVEAAPAEIEFTLGQFRVVGTDKAIPLLELPARLAQWTQRPADLPDTLNNVA